METSAKNELVTNSFDTLKEKVDSSVQKNFWEKIINEHGSVTVCKLYKLADEDVDDPTLSVFPLLECGDTEAKNEGLQHLLLDLAYKFKYFPMGNEAARSQFVSVFLLAIADYFKGGQDSGSQGERPQIGNSPKYRTIRQPIFRLSKPLAVVYGDNDLENRVKKIVGTFIWLLNDFKSFD
ncbi:19252_t:CDS:2 [Gigaspora margarita]|uniref:19252_t:CDS:1 n=1 Tax=Gigaspora margarita TaxID=4874 RepID=A0ABN7V899_GIGMA|nr:19252_t:CDS:2 [Gigaspora margarita]